MREFPRFEESNKGYEPLIGWREDERFTKNDKGRPLSTIGNVTWVLRHHPNLNGRFQKSALDDKISIIKPLPDELPGTPLPRLINDADLYTIMSFISREGLNVSKDAVYGGILETVKRYTVNPLHKYLNDCYESWDGKPRISHMLHKLFGVDDTTYTQAVSRKFMIGAVARGLEPGCQMDNMLIIEGKGGIGKSTGIAALVPNTSWLVDTLPDVSSKEAPIQIRGKWIVELAELAGHSRREREAFKSFITSRIDTYRAPYERTTGDVPRMCVLVGTTNDTSYLDDPTGNRRFWPVLATDVKVDIIKSVRNQLWGEAVAAWLNGEEWSLTVDEAAMASNEQDSRYDEDPWTDAVIELLEDKNEVTIAEILELLGVEVKDHDQRKKSRVKSILIKDGWVSSRLFSKANRNKYGYRRG